MDELDFGFGWADDSPLRRAGHALADAVGTIPHYFRAGDEPLGVHPLLRLRPPRTLMGLEPLHVLVGHGDGVHGEGTGRALDDAIAHARRRIPRWVLGLPKLRRTSS